LVSLLEGEGTGVRNSGVGYNHRQLMSPTTVYKVTIQATPVGADQWKVVASGTWTPGQQPQLEQTLSAEVIEALFGTAMRGRPELSVCELAIHRQFAVSIRSPHVIGPEYLFPWYGCPIVITMLLTP
jgi:hypothetical protein